ncbi:MAG TPA: glycosyltransferase family 39 protein [Alphaproteobacteria bacterium]|nr:glycosyltransferase family 39 protein [Alphaproteobacteria bacterium]
MLKAMNRPLWILFGLAAIVHLATAGRYDAMRNELYFIICGRHPDFGYVDQPSLVPLIAAATQMFGNSVWLLRLPAVLAVLAMIPLTAALTRLMGGDGRAAFLAALMTTIAPLLVAIGTLMTTETFEPLTWTALSFLVAAAWVRQERRMLLWAGLAAGIALQMKYGMVIWMIGLLIGVLATPARRMMAWREFWLGALIAAVIVAPSIVWQAAHGWPFLEVTRNHSAGNFTGAPIRFTIGQIVRMNPILAPLWIAGLIGPFLREGLKPFRFLAIAFVVSAAIIIASHGKDYYLVPAYPTVFALGAVTVSGLKTLPRRIWIGAALVTSAIVAPVVLPLLDPPQLERYLAATHLKPKPDEAAGVGAPLTQVFSDELGWRAFEKQVAAAYNALPPEDRAKAAIVTIDYGEAAALDYYGPADGLPPAMSGQNQYYLWGAHGHDGSVMLHINGKADRWVRACASAEVVGTFGAPYAMPYENDRPIILCRGLKANLSDTWARFRHFD